MIPQKEFSPWPRSCWYRVDMDCDEIAGKEYKSRFQGWVRGSGPQPFNMMDSSATRSRIATIAANVLIVVRIDPAQGVLSAKQLRQ